MKVLMKAYVKIKTNCFNLFHAMTLYNQRLIQPEGNYLNLLFNRVLSQRMSTKGLLSLMAALGIGAFLCLGLFSCNPYKKITYFKNLGDSSSIYTQGKDITTAKYQPLLIQSDDILQVVISTIDPSANEVFNINQEESTASNSDVFNMPKRINGYLVDKNGNIEVPVLGAFHVAGLTTEQIKNQVLAAASKLLKQPVVNVRLANFTVNVLGEVARPGSYVIDGEKASVLDALGLAGDMTIYGKRENVVLMRTENGTQKKVARFNLNNTDLLSSPYFYLRQDDVIYVEPSKAKAASTDMSATKTYAIAGSVLSVLLIVISRL